MKIISNTRLIFWGLLLSIVAGACSSTEEYEGGDLFRITADVESLEAAPEGGSYTINIGVPGKGVSWQAIVSDADWLTVTPESGRDETGHYSLKVDVSPLSGHSRNCRIIVFTTDRRLEIPVSQTLPARDGCCELSETQVSFQPAGCGYRKISVAAYEDLVIDVAGGEWVQLADMPSGIVRAGDKFDMYVAPEGPSTKKRTAEISFTGQDTGNKSYVTLTQEAVMSSDALPARWYYTNDEANASGWTTSDATAVANHDKGKGKAWVTAVGTNNRRLTHSISTTYKNSIALSGLYSGDYILFSIPSGNIEAGTGVDFMLTIASADNSAPKYWICEILDGDSWTAPKDTDLKQTPDGEKYSFYTKNFSSYQHTSFTQSFILCNKISDGMMRIRCRVVGSRNGSDGILSPDNGGAIYLPSHEFHFCTVSVYPGVAVKDVKKVGILGNSFTHYFASAFLLKEIARSQGHQLDIHVNAKGSQYFTNHMTLELSKVVYEEKDYDYVFMQEQSQRYSQYAADPQQNIVDECKALSAKFRENSSSAVIFLENTWAFPKSNWDSHGSIDNFSDKLLAGTLAVAKSDLNVSYVSPIGEAFRKAWLSGITDLYYTDSKHPNRNGAYLKSCVNYLMMFGEPFNADVTDGGCDSAVAAQLRKIAEQTVIGHQAQYDAR